MEFLSLGLMPYTEVREIQEEAVAALIAGRSSEKVLLCEHPPTVTLGRRTKNWTASETLLQQQGFEIHKVKRGGEATLHLPGQLVVYPVIAFRERGLSVRQLVESLLRCLVQTVNRFGLTASACSSPAGVFTPGGLKLGSVGLELIRGVTNHGMSLNVLNKLEPFSLIVPCGREDIRATSLSLELNKKVQIGEVIPHLKSQLSEILP